MHTKKAIDLKKNDIFVYMGQVYCVGSPPIKISAEKTKGINVDFVVIEIKLTHDASSIDNYSEIVIDESTSVLLLGALND